MYKPMIVSNYNPVLVFYSKPRKKAHARRIGDKKSDILPKNVAMIVTRKAKEDAKKAFLDVSTLGKYGDQFGRTLKKLDKDPKSVYYRHGKLAYELFCETLLKEDGMLENRSLVSFIDWDNL